jgi:hypothetical protein
MNAQSPADRAAVGAPGERASGDGGTRNTPSGRTRTQLGSSMLNMVAQVMRKSVSKPVRSQSDEGEQENVGDVGVSDDEVEVEERDVRCQEK